jgi:hypothetical protein
VSVQNPERVIPLLAPVREALLQAARVDAEATLAMADATVAAHLAAAQAESDRLLAEARADAAADADRLIARERAATRRHAQFVVLSARRAVYDQLRTRARAAVVAVRDQDGYLELRGRLAAHARGRFGPAAVVHLDLPGFPGVVAEAGGRRLDLTLTALADRAFEELAGQVELLWQ